MKRGQRKRDVAGMAIESDTLSRAEKEVWPEEEKLLHRINKDSDQDLGEKRIECRILRQIKENPD